MPAWRSIVIHEVSACPSASQVRCLEPQGLVPQRYGQDWIPLYLFSAFRWWALKHGKVTHWECQRVDTGKQSIHRHSRLLSAWAEHTNQGWYSLGLNQHAPHLPWMFYSQFSRMSMSQNLFEFLLEKRTSQQNSTFSVLHGFLFACLGHLDWVKAVLTWELR